MQKECVRRATANSDGIRWHGTANIRISLIIQWVSAKHVISTIIIIEESRQENKKMMNLVKVLASQVSTK